MALNGKARWVDDDHWKLTAYLPKEGNKYPRKTRLIEYVSTNPDDKKKPDKKIERMLRDYLLEIERELTEQEIENDDQNQFSPSDQSLKEYLEQWLAIVKPDLERPTYESYKWEVDNHITPIMGNIPLSALAPIHIQEFYAGKIEHGKLTQKDDNGQYKGLSARSVQYLHSILHQALERAVDLELIERNPCGKIKPPKDKRRKEEKLQLKVLDVEQLTKFLESAADHRDYALIFTAAYTGARQSELLALKWDNIDFKKKTIRIDGAVKLLEDGTFEDGRTKNVTSTREIDITARVVSCLKQHKKQLAAYKIKTGIKNPLNLVFPDLNGNYMNRKNLANRFKNLASNLGYEGFTFHGLRHTHATILLSRGWYIVDVSRRLGHANVDTTLRIYAHYIPKQQAALAKKFDEILDGK